jgi:hypothetical protein
MQAGTISVPIERRAGGPPITKTQQLLADMRLEKLKSRLNQYVLLGPLTLEHHMILQ